ncbi:MAG: hypothetical protein IT210_05165 [Armatimonadetes bacterium]|nr:hypothetical protein [Armatimonadota bacterium]
MRYDPNEHLIRLRGNQDYLPVAQRLVWFREVHPDWSIETHPIILDIEQGVAVFEATIKEESGRILARATKMENHKDFNDYVEKAETGAVGRALAMCGFGTQFAPEFDSSEAGEPIPSLEAAPPPRTEPQPQPQQAQTKPSPGVKEAPQAPSGPPVCANCRQPITPHSKYNVEKLIEMSVHKYGEPLCYKCALDRAKKG